jgi:hypothetical protein
MKLIASKLSATFARSDSVLFPDVERCYEEVVDARDCRGLQQQLRLRSALLAGHQYFRDGCGFRVQQLSVHFAYEVAPQRNQEKHAQAAAGQADEDGLHRMRVELQDVERG